MISPKTVLITGASSGIGAALARHYAAPGVLLFLSGRDEKRLAEIAQDCTKKGAKTATKQIDVTDRAAMQDWIESADAQSPLDLVIANAGISAGMGGGASESGENPQQVRSIFDTNLYGVLNTIDPILPRMTARGRGQIALMSSLAGFRGWPGAPAYAASKAAVRSYGEGLGGAMARRGVLISVICPGFVESRMTAVNTFPMPFLMRADKAAEIIAAGLVRGKTRIAFPWPVYAFVWLGALIPDRWARALLSRLPAKASTPAPAPAPGGKTLG